MTFTLADIFGAILTVLKATGNGLRSVSEEIDLILAATEKIKAILPPEEIDSDIPKSRSLQADHIAHMAILLLKAQQSPQKT